MMTKEEVEAIVCYCEEHRMSQSARLNELGIPKWKFFYSKRVHLRTQCDSVSRADFIRVVPRLREPQPGLCRRGRGADVSEAACVSPITVSVSTAEGDEIVFSGALTNAQIECIVNSVRRHV